MSFILNGVLALGQSVPQLDGLVTTARHDLSVVSRECHRQDIFSVILEETQSKHTIKLTNYGEHTNYLSPQIDVLSFLAANPRVGVFCPNYHSRHIAHP